MRRAKVRRARARLFDFTSKCGAVEGLSLFVDTWPVTHSASLPHSDGNLPPASHTCRSLTRRHMRVIRWRGEKNGRLFSVGKRLQNVHSFSLSLCFFQSFLYILSLCLCAHGRREESFLSSVFTTFLFAWISRRCCSRSRFLSSLEITLAVICKASVQLGAEGYRWRPDLRSQFLGETTLLKDMLRGVFSTSSGARWRWHHVHCEGRQLCTLHALISVVVGTCYLSESSEMSGVDWYHDCSVLSAGFPARGLSTTLLEFICTCSQTTSPSLCWSPGMLQAQIFHVFYVCCCFPIVWCLLICLGMCCQ